MIDRRKVSQAYQAMKHAKAAGTLGQVNIAAEYGLTPAEAAQVMRQVEFAARYGGRKGKNRAATVSEPQTVTIRFAPMMVRDIVATAVELFSTKYSFDEAGSSVTFTRPQVRAFASFLRDVAQSEFSDEGDKELAAEALKKIEGKSALLNRRCNKCGSRRRANKAGTRWDEEQALIKDAIAKFPATFGLRAFPGKVFRLSERASYVSEGQVLLYSQRKMPDGQWLDFAKGTIDEFKREIVPLRETASNRARGKRRRIMSDEELEAHRATHTRANSWWLKDIRGIEVARVCDECEESVKARYRPEIFGEGESSYEDVVEEPIEPEDY